MKLFTALSTALVISFFNFTNATSADEDVLQPIKQPWNFEGMLGTFDKQSAQRGYKVYKEVCSACHGMRLIKFRNLEGIGYSPEQVKAIAAEYEIDVLDDEGQDTTRMRVPNDAFPDPYSNKLAAAAANGKYPPDLSLMYKARPDGGNYIYSLLMGYKTPPKDLDLGVSYYNPYFPGKLIAMPPQLNDGMVEYDDGTKATKDQMAKDLVNFLQWSAEPEMEQRKSMGLKVLIFLSIMTIFFYLAKLRIWKDVK